jgi:hypothetical protein
MHPRNPAVAMELPLLGRPNRCIHNAYLQRDVLTDGHRPDIGRTRCCPWQVLNILVGGSAAGKGWFFPDGVNGRIKTPVPLSPPVRTHTLAAQSCSMRAAQ